MTLKWKEIWSFTKELFKTYLEDDALSLGASLAYYTVFSFAPIIVIVIALASIFYGQAAVQGELYEQLSGLLGAQAAAETQKLVENAYQTGESKLATIVSIVTLVFGATGLFNVMKNSLNRIWALKATPKNGIINFLMNRVLSFGMVVTIGFLLLVSLVLQSFLIAFSDKLSAYFSETATIFTQVASGIISLVLTAFLFALIYKVLPDAKLRWKDVAVGSVFTAILFAIGKYAIGIYLGNSSISNTFGAAGSVVVLMVWTYYTSQILFFGAEFTYIYAMRYGRKIEPNDHAVAVVRKEVEVNHVKENKNQPVTP